MFSRRQISCLLVPFFSMALAAQQGPLPPNPATQTPAPATTDTPSQPPPANLLQDGMPIKLQLLNKLDSHTAKAGEEIQLEVVNDVVVNGFTLLRRGAPATGVVTDAGSSKTMGRAGKLTFTINDIELRNGDKVQVRAFHRTTGENRTGEMIGYMVSAPIVAAPFFLLMHGTNTVFPRGTEITAFVNGDVRLNLASFGSALQITSTPEDAQILIDGESAGNTPANIKVTAGKHEISIKKAGFSDWSKTVEANGDTALVEAVLEALPSK